MVQIVRKSTGMGMDGIRSIKLRMFFFTLFILWVGINLAIAISLLMDDLLYFSMLKFMMVKIPFLFIGSDHSWEYANDLNLFLAGVFQLGLVPLWFFSLKKYSKDLIENAASTPDGINELKRRSDRFGRSSLLLVNTIGFIVVCALFDSRFGDGPMVLAVVAHSYILSSLSLAVCCFLDLTCEMKSTQFMALMAILAPFTFLVFWGSFFILLQFVISIISVVILIQKIESRYRMR